MYHGISIDELCKLRKYGLEKLLNGGCITGWITVFKEYSSVAQSHTGRRYQEFSRFCHRSGTAVNIFICDLEDGIKCTFRMFLGNTKLGEVEDTGGYH